jgi:hypothetical protein
MRRRHAGKGKAAPVRGLSRFSWKKSRESAALLTGILVPCPKWLPSGLARGRRVPVVILREAMRGKEETAEQQHGGGLMCDCKVQLDAAHQRGNA